MKSHLVILVALLVIIAGCTTQTPVEEQQVEVVEEPAIEEPVVMVEPAQGSSSSIDITRKAFVPAELRVKLGTVVTWVNKDTIGHTVSFRGATGYSQYSGIVPAGKTMEVVFNDVGEFPYINGALGIQGTVIVEE